MTGTDAGPLGYRMADIEIDVGTRVVRRGEAVLPLPGLSFDLLLALVRRAPNVVTSGELMAEVWTGRVVNDETVAKRVELVRDALGDDSRQSRYITVVRGRGYRITAPVEPVTERGVSANAPVPASETATAPAVGPAADSTAPATVVAQARAPRARPRWAIPAALLGICALGTLIAWSFWPRVEPARDPASALAQLPSRPALAVLPLDNLSTGDSGEYFAAGMHDALIADLSKASGIKVISRTSTLPYRASGKSLSAIARELGVDLLIEGSVLRADDRVRITLQLLDAHDTHLWAEHYEGDLRDVLRLQSQVARAVADAVKVKLSPAEDARLSSERPVNTRSYELYLQGKTLTSSRKPEDFEAGIALMTRAAEIDPTSPLPYANLAMEYAQRAHAPGAAKSLYPRATAYALQAIGLDENLAEGHAALAQMRLYFHWDWKGAEESFRKVFELTPIFAAAHGHYGWLRVLHDDYAGGVAELKLASELDPNDPLWPSWLGWVHLWGGNDAEAAKTLETVLLTRPDYPVAHHVLGQTYLRLQRVDDAIVHFKRAAELSPRWSWGLGQGLAAAGKMGEARAIAARFEKNEVPDPWALAEIYTATGDIERALHWIENGYEVRRDWMPWIMANPFFQPLSDQPRFREIVRRLDLPTPTGGQVRADRG